jgi:hypothetical protein
MRAACLPDRGRPRAQRRRRSSSAPRPARWMVYGFCPLTGPWRQIVQAETAGGALVKYAAEHDMPVDSCHVRPD